MRKEVIMPKWYSAMEKGTILEWHRRKGDRVAPGYVIAAIEAHPGKNGKFTQSLLAKDTGTLTELVAAEGQEVPVGDVIAIIEATEEATEESPSSVTDQLFENSAAKPQRGAQDPAAATRRLNVVFSEAAYDDLKKLADQSGKTISGVVRDAIALQKWFNGVRREGGRILVEQGGKVREIMNIR